VAIITVAATKSNRTQISFENARRAIGGHSHFSGFALWPPFLRVSCEIRGAGFINQKFNGDRLIAKA
jgi:hypothetical protein